VVVDRTRRSDGERVDGVRLISFRRANGAEARTYEAISSGKN
jgi:uncharacterized DUF497 family protein